MCKTYNGVQMHRETVLKYLILLILMTVQWMITGGTEKQLSTVPIIQWSIIFK